MLRQVSEQILRPLEQPWNGGTISPWSEKKTKEDASNVRYTHQQAHRSVIRLLPLSTTFESDSHHTERQIAPGIATALFCGLFYFITIMELHYKRSGDTLDGRRHTRVTKDTPA